MMSEWLVHGLLLCHQSVNCKRMGQLFRAQIKLIKGGHILRKLEPHTIGTTPHHLKPNLTRTTFWFIEVFGNDTTSLTLVFSLQHKYPLHFVLQYMHKILTNMTALLGSEVTFSSSLHLWHSGVSNQQKSLVHPLHCWPHKADIGKWQVRVGGTG